MTNKLPSFQFYVGDWKKDPGVQALSYHDRGIWFEIICLMHESEERGKLILNGKPMPEDALARLLGVDKPTLEQALTNILAYGVASKDKNGVIINRRMIRDEEKRETLRQHGKNGGNPALCENYNSPGFVYAIKRKDGAIKIGIALNPKNRIDKIKYKLNEDSIETISIAYVLNMGKEEKKLHDKYDKWCVGGEWFNLDEEMELDLISTLKGMNMGEHKQNKRASSSSSSSSSSSDIYMGDKPPKTFKPPTIQEVIGYSKSIDFNLDANKFIDFYTAKNWMIGKNKMKDWKAAVRTWKSSTTEANRDNVDKTKQKENRLADVRREAGLSLCHGAKIEEYEDTNNLKIKRCSECLCEV